jgi:hypothetical protein
MNALRTFSTFSSETRRRRPACSFKTLPVSRSLLCFDPLCAWCCFLIKTMKLAFHPHNRLRKPHKNSRLLLSWRHFCVKWQQRPKSGPWGSLKI